MTPHQIGALLSVAAMFVAQGIAGLLGYEAYALWKGKKPITWLVRDEEQAHARWVLLLMMIASMLIGHFLKF